MGRSYKSVGGVKLQRLRQRRIIQVLQRIPVMLRAAGGLGFGFDAAVDAAALFGDLGQVAHAAAGDQHGGARLLQLRVEGGRPLLRRQLQLLAQQAAQVGEHPADAGVVELAGDGGIHRHVGIRRLERHAVALPLLAHVAQGVFCAALVVLVQHDQLGEVDHVDLLQLAGRTVVAGHHVHGEVDQVDDLRIALAYAGGLHDHQVEAQRLQEGDAILQHGIGRHVLAAGGHRTHVDALAAQRVHADAVAEQRATGTAAGGIDRDHRDVHLREARQEAVHQLVGDRRLAGAAGAGDADHGRGTRGERRVGALGPLRAQLLQVGVGIAAILDGAEHAADAGLVGELGLRRRSVPIGGDLHAAFLGALDHILDHFHQAHLHAVVGVVDPLHAVSLQFGDLFRGDGAAAAAEHAHVAGAAFLQHVDHVLEVFDVPALVTGQRDAVGVFLQRGAHDILDAAVVAQVDHFRTLALDQPPHDVDGGVVPVEQAGRGHEAQRRTVGLGGGKLAGGCTHACSLTVRMQKRDCSRSCVSTSPFAYQWTGPSHDTAACGTPVSTARTAAHAWRRRAGRRSRHAGSAATHRAFPARSSRGGGPGRWC